MSESLHLEVVILNAALELPPSARGVYLDEACAGDPRLREQVTALLTAIEKADDFMEAPLTGSNLREPATALVNERPGDKIGRYKLLQQIGEGGCGVVYKAEQEEPVRREVALKVIKLGMDTRQVIARFEAERQALAMMDHPNIARVFDAGATDAGRPYFVMELVRGVRITDYCRENEVSIENRLKLFAEVCQAIQHAHQKGIVHRDIKPSNILIAGDQRMPVPKVIDFGIAKAIQGRLTTQTVLTGAEPFIGTPAYMSPEQAATTNPDIDTRSDVYSLGVLLYELLTGRTPFDQKKLLTSGLDEMRRTIREVDPLRPSMQLARANDATQSASTSVDKDLDWIVMKCLEKDRSRRYETVNGLAADIHRHLNHEPITARPPSHRYRFQKLIQRNKIAFAAIMVVTLALIVTAVGSTLAAWRVAGARRAERDERRKAESANHQLRQTVSLLELERAEDLFRANDAAAGVAHLAAILRNDPSNHIAAARLISALVHRNWALPAGAPMLHPDSVELAFFSPNGEQVLTSSRDNNVRVYAVATGKLMTTLAHSDRVTAAQFGPDGQRILTACASGSAQLWNPVSGAPLNSPLEHHGKVNWAEFSPDGKSVVTASSDKTARIWDGVTGGLKCELRGHSAGLMLARFSPDGNRIVTGATNGSVKIWDTASGKFLWQVESNLPKIITLAFSPDGRWLVSARADGVARLWNTVKSEAVGKPLVHKDSIEHAVFSPNSKLVLTTSQDGTARLWEAESGYPFGVPFVHAGRIHYGTFSPDGQAVLTTSIDNSTRLWDVNTGLLRCQPLRQYERVLHADFTRDGQRIVAASFDRMAQVWDIRFRQAQAVLVHPNIQATSISFSADGKRVLTSSFDKTARVWNAQNGKPLGQPMRHEKVVQHAQFSPDGQRVVTACAGGPAAIWDLKTGQAIANLIGHSNSVWPVEFDRGGTRVLTASIDGTARLWDARNGHAIAQPMAHVSEVSMAHFSPNGRYVLTASKDRNARVWDTETGQPLFGPMAHWDKVQWADFSPDGERIITASVDNTACIWNAHTGERLTPPLQHARTVEKAVFSPDGKRVATASLDRTARIWDAATGQAMTPPLAHDSPLTWVFFSPNGRRILTSCRNGDVRLWDANTGRPLTEWLNGGEWVWGTCFDPTGQRIAVAAKGGHIWNLPEAPVPVPSWFPAFAEAVGGIRLSSRGNVELVPRSELEQFVQQSRGESSEFYGRLGAWFLASPTNRAADPF